VRSGPRFRSSVCVYMVSILEVFQEAATGDRMRILL